MSRLCRLKTSSHGEDGKWAYQEITTLRAQLEIAVGALEILSKTEHCDCGCPNGSKPVALKPQHVFAIAQEALTKISEVGKC